MKNKKLHWNTKHGYHRTKIYKAWDSMKYRCYNKNCKFYDYYGGRGIKICKRWQGKNGFINFLADMGLPPTKNHSLDRVDVNGDYKPSNCRWATKSEQAHNKRIYGKSGIRNVYFDKRRDRYVVHFSRSFKSKMTAKKHYNKFSKIFYK